MKTTCQTKSSTSSEGLLTSRQRQILDMLLSFARERGYQPSIRDICTATGIRNPNGVHCHLRALRKKGHIGKCMGARAIDLSPSLHR